MARDKLNTSGSILETASQMAEGNPGAATVVGKLLTKDPFILLNLDDMNIRGSQIWVAFKYHCGEDIDLLAEKILDRDAEMVRYINLCPDCGDEVAVTGGASYA